MKSFRNIAEFRAFLATEFVQRVRAGKATGLAAGIELVADEMRGELGTYQSGDAGFEDMQKLSPRTVEGWDAIGGRLEGKIERGYATPGDDKPLEASGVLKGSIGTTVEGDAAAAGSSDPVAVWMNDGTDERGVPFVPGQTTSPGVPGREFVGRAGFRTAPKVADVVGEKLAEALST